jgi:diguanylate cyclase (GGDEF)-like protein
MHVLIGSSNENWLEKMGIFVTNLNLVPLFCDDAQLLISTMRDQHFNVHMILIDSTLTDDVATLLMDLRNCQMDQYPYIVMFDASDIENTVDVYLQYLQSGADKVLDISTDPHVLQVHLNVALRMLEHQVKQLKLQENLWNQANYDPLTEISNRRSILASLRRQAALCQQRQQPLGLLMIDLDFFKRINDTYGHDCGDVVLKEAAKRMKNCIRNSDSIGRFGGEEFLAVIPNCSDEELLRLAERIREALKKSVGYKHFVIPLTASIGVSVYFQNDEDVLTSLNEADRSLYAAKEMGRDRVVCSWLLDEYNAQMG